LNGADEKAYKTVVVADVEHHHIDADKVNADGEVQFVSNKVNVNNVDILLNDGLFCFIVMFIISSVYLCIVFFMTLCNRLRSDCNDNFIF
jgi:hypothetical protein